MFLRILFNDPGIRVWNLHSSLQDGKALLALLQALHGEEAFDPMEHPPVSQLLSYS